MDDVILLTFEDTEVVTSETGEPVDKVIVKRYTYSDINDLQSRLTLIAAEKQSKNKVTIKNFENVSCYMILAMTTTSLG